MAIRTFAVASFTSEAVADAAAMANSKHMNLLGNGTAQYTRIKEVYCGGLESATSSPQKMLLARDGTIGASLTALTTGESDTPDDPNTAALAAPVFTFTASGTACQRAKAYLSALAFNALGGIVRVRFALNEEPAILGNGTTNGEVSLSGFTGTVAGLMSAHIKFETLAIVLACGLSLLVSS